MYFLNEENVFYLQIKQWNSCGIPMMILEIQIKFECFVLIEKMLYNKLSFLYSIFLITYVNSILNKNYSFEATMYNVTSSSVNLVIPLIFFSKNLIAISFCSINLQFSNIII